MTITQKSFELSLLTFTLMGIVTSVRAEEGHVLLFSPPILTPLVSANLSIETNPTLANESASWNFNSFFVCGDPPHADNNLCLSLVANQENFDDSSRFLNANSLFANLQQNFDFQITSLDSFSLVLNFSPELIVQSSLAESLLNSQYQTEMGLKDNKKQVILDSLVTRISSKLSTKTLSRSLSSESFNEDKLEASISENALAIIFQNEQTNPEDLPPDRLRLSAPIVAQADALPATPEIENEPSEQSLNELRQELRIKPKVILSAQVYPPSLSAGIPSAFGANWGDTFVSVSGATPGKSRFNKTDGSMTLGFGLGDSYQLAGLTFAYNIGSIRKFGSNGTFDLQGSRVVHASRNNQVAIAAGWSSFAQYGSEIVIPSTVWGAVTSVSLLQPDDPINKLPLLLSVGLGGGYFSEYEGSTNAFGGIGLQVAPQLGVGVAWSGVGLNLGLSFVPVPTLPLTISATGGDLTNTSQGGSRFILSISYGYNFVPRGY
ncbi:MAG: hypothetical protein VKL42_11945 [Snowella sp.]|nr:hypothetical protein [Snowella sp.]